MTLSRRAFVRTMGLSGAAALVAPAVTARGREAARSIQPASPTGSNDGIIRLDSNENPNGPGTAAVDAIVGSLGEASRYPDLPEDALQEAIARSLRIPAENVVTGCGSTEILRMAVQEFTSAGRALVTAVPSFEVPSRHAHRLGSPVIEVPVDASLKLALDTMAIKAAGAGLVYLCNPNNPTGTVHGTEVITAFTNDLGRTSPETTVLIDEAYLDYAEGGEGATAIPRALANPRVIVSRTFSKLHGLAGMRVGYAVGSAPTIKALAGWRLPSGVNGAGAAGAIASLADTAHIEEERRRNRETRAFVRGFFSSSGFEVVPSEANFIMVNVRRPARGFRDACRERGVRIGRPFPPLDTHARISIGTMDEMRRAVEVFREILEG